MAPARLGLALISQLGFQAETLASLWLHSPHYSLASHRNYFRHGPEDIDYVEIRDERLQGQVIAPTRGVSDCYDMDDFTRAETGSGKGLVMRTMREWKPSNTAAEVHARFSTWSHIRLSLECPLFGGDSFWLLATALMILQWIALGIRGGVGLARI